MKDTDESLTYLEDDMPAELDVELPARVYRVTVTNLTYIHIPANTLLEAREAVSGYLRALSPVEGPLGFSIGEV